MNPNKARNLHEWLASVAAVAIVFAGLVWIDHGAWWRDRGVVVIYVMVVAAVALAVWRLRRP